MAIVEIELVRSKFEPGDSPKGSDYLDLIDSLAALPDISGKQDVVANVSSTEIGYLDGVTSAIQTQINTKAPTASPTFTGTVTIPSGSAITGVPYLATANTFTGGVQQITTASAATVGLIVKGAASQTANLQEWHSNAGTVSAKVEQDGTISSISGGFFGTVNSPISYGNYLAVRPWSANHVPFTVKGFTAQTSDLTRWVNDAGTTLASITSNGGITVSSNITQSSSGRTFIGGASDYGAFLNTGIPTASRQGIVVRANASQTANLQEWQDSAGTVLSYVNSAGVIVSTAGAYLQVSGGYGIQSTAGSATTVPIIAQGAASQTANLQQWQDSAGNIISKVNAFGDIFTLNGRFFRGSQDFGAGINVAPGSTTQKGIVVRALASQTASLQEWQDSAGTVLAKVNSSGNIVAGNMAIATSSVSTIHISNGTIPSADPTGGGVLYVEAGALKFRGSSGTVTTIAVA